MNAPLEEALRELVRGVVREELAKAAPVSSAPRLYSVAETAEMLGGLSRAFVYRELLGTGRLASRRIGGRRLVSSRDVETFIEGIDGAAVTSTAGPLASRGAIHAHEGRAPATRRPSGRSSGRCAPAPGRGAAHAEVDRARARKAS